MALALRDGDGVLTAALILLGLVVLVLALAERPVKRLPLSPAVIYLSVGWLAGAVLGAPAPQALELHAPILVLVLELAVLVSLFAVGLRLRVLPTFKSWRVALLLAGPGMVITILLATLAAFWLLDLAWPVAFVLAAIVAPTDPVLASDVQIRSDQDRDVVRLAITAEGGINDGTALPAVMLALGLMGLHALGPSGANWWWADLLWPIGGGAALGAGLGLLLGWALKQRALGEDPLERDEFIYAGALLLALGLARATATSSFVLVFVAGVTLLLPMRGMAGQGLAERLHAFGARCERLVEAATVLAVGVMLNSVPIGWPELAFALVMAIAVRPLAVLAVVRRPALQGSQRQLVAWFGIRGIGSLYYLLFVLEHNVTGGLAQRLVSATLVCVAASIVLHGVSATPLMARHQRRKAAALKSRS